MFFKDHQLPKPRFLHLDGQFSKTTDGAGATESGSLTFQNLSNSSQAHNLPIFKIS